MLTLSPARCVGQVCLSMCSWGKDGGPEKEEGWARKQQVGEG